MDTNFSIKDITYDTIGTINIRYGNDLQKRTAVLKVIAKGLLMHITIDPSFEALYMFVVKEYRHVKTSLLYDTINMVSNTKVPVVIIYNIV